MSGIIDFLSSSGRIKTINGIDSLIQITNFNPRQLDIFHHGLELADNLLSLEGVVLITKGTKILPETMRRLLDINLHHSDYKFQFNVLLSDEFLDNYRNRIIKRFKNLIRFKESRQGYVDLYKVCSKNFFKYLKLLLESDEMTMIIYKQIVITNMFKKKSSALFLNHTYSVVLYCFGILNTKIFQESYEMSDSDITNTLAAAFFHNIGSLTDAERILLEKPAKIKQFYDDANMQSDSIVENNDMDSDISDAIRKENDYFYGRIEISQKEKKKSDIIANILIIAIMFNKSDTGLFVDKMELSTNLDNLNVLAMNGRANKKMVQSLTSASQFMDLFDFYEELESLLELCPSTDSRAYPMTGFKSPTLFVCSANKKDCEFYEGSLKAVHIVTPVGDLKEGGYARCTQSTGLLHKFYDEHYRNIKAELNKENGD